MLSSKNVFNSFTRRLTETLGYHNQLMQTVQMNRRRASLETMLVEQFVLSLAVLWEAFLNDLIAAYVIEDPTRFLEGLELRIEQSVSDKFGEAVSKRVWFTPPRTITRSQAIAMIDPKGWNIGANSAQALSDLANNLLTGAVAKKFSLDSEDRVFVDLLFGVRNFLSHRSTRSRTLVKEAISMITGSGVNEHLRGTFTTAGSYLKARAGPSDTRATYLARRVISIAEKLS